MNISKHYNFDASFFLYKSMDDAKGIAVVFHGCDQAAEHINVLDLIIQMKETVTFVIAIFN